MNEKNRLEFVSPKTPLIVIDDDLVEVLPPTYSDKIPSPIYQDQPFIDIEAEELTTTTKKTMATPTTPMKPKKEAVKPQIDLKNAVIDFCKMLKLEFHILMN